MSEPKLYNDVRDIGFKFLSNIVSFKYQTGIMVTVAFFMHLLPWYAWLPSLLAIASIRGWEKLIIWGKRTQEIGEEVETVETPTTEG